MPSFVTPRHTGVRRIGLGILLTLLGGALLPPGGAAAAAGASGVYTGPCAVSEASAFGSWRGRPNSVIVDTLDMRRFSNIADPSWWTGCWGRSAPVVYGVAMVTQDDGGSLRAGASGAYDGYFRSLAQKLVSGGQPGAWLRLGFEFNGSWFPWRAASDPASFTAYYKRIVNTMRAVPGSQFKYVWNPTIGAEEFPAERAWPGSAYVDAIGIDLYDASWAPGTYPVPAGSTSLQTRARQDTAWRNYKTMDHGLDWWVRYAATQHKPLALPEWGLVPTSHNGGGDDPMFIQRVHYWASQHSIAFESYFNAVGDLGDHRLLSGQYPQAATRYQRLFGSVTTRRGAPTPTASPIPTPAFPRPLSAGRAS